MSAEAVTMKLQKVILLSACEHIETFSTGSTRVVFIVTAVQHTESNEPGGRGAIIL